MAKKKANSLELSGVRVNYDPKNGSLRLTSKDPDLRGKAFNITLTSNSTTSNTLLELMEAKGVELGHTEVPNRCSFDDVRGLENTYEPYSPLSFTLGRDELELRIDLAEHGSLLLAGRAGGGKTVMMRALARQAMLRPNFRVHLFNTRRSEIAPEILRPNDEYLPGFSQITQRLEALIGLMEERLKLLKAAGAVSMNELAMEESYTYELLLIDGLEEVIFDGPFEESAAYYKAASNANLARLGQLIRLGRAARIHVVVASQFGGDSVTDELIPLFSARVLFGSNPQGRHWKVLQQKPQYGEHMLQPIGRAILGVDKKLTLFQSVFTNWE